VFPRILALNLCILIVAATFSHAQVPSSSASNAETLKLWERYKAVFVQPDGRVIDIWQNNISHSESQGYGLLNSVLFDDRKTFQAIWQWTRNNLQARKDNLLPWAWGKRNNGLWEIIDYNNATDGDVLVAYALIQASARWHSQDYGSEGRKIIEGIRKHLPANWKNKTYLLPAYYGFQKDDKLILNPSYLIISAYRAFAEVDDRVFWRKIYDDSLDLIQNSSFGKLKLPADWISLNDSGISMWEEKSPLFGYEAIRTILYLSWEKAPHYPQGMYDILKIYEKQGYIPLYADLQKNTISLDDAPAGFYAVYGRAAEKSGLKALSSSLFKRAFEKAAAEKNDYYSLTLFLLATHTIE
jgi:endo-1,4-beta-D-glucanase Y